MNKVLRDIWVLGIHPVRPTAEEFQEALETQWGSELSKKEMAAARRNVQEHFDGLYLIEVQLLPAKAELDWGEITQPQKNVPKSNWQVPYDENEIDPSTDRWVFFLHSVDLNKPLSTPIGERPLPKPTSLPSHLKSIPYEVP